MKAEGREPSGPGELACNKEDNLPIGEVGRGSGRVGRSVHPSLLLVAWYRKCPPRDGLRRTATTIRVTSHKSGRARALRSRRAPPDGLRRTATTIRASVS